MYLHGETINKRDKRVSVEILTHGRRVPEIVIGVDDVYLDGVSIEAAVESLTDVVLARSATISVVARELMPELHAADYRDTVVAIKVEGATVFLGHVQPQSYSQGYAGVYDSYEVNCIDALGASDLTKYRDAGSLDAPWDEVRANAGMQSLGDIVEGIVSELAAPFAALDQQCALEWMTERPIDDTGDETRDRAELSELLFLADDEDETWTRKRVLEEVLRYLDLHIVQDGANFRIFGWESTGQGETTAICTMTAADDQTSISMGEIYNKITVAAEPTNVDMLLDAPLDDNDLTSPYSGRQLYCIEARRDTSKDSGTSSPDIRPMEKTEMILSGQALPETVRWPGWYKREWTIRVMTHPSWTFHPDEYPPCQNSVPDSLRSTYGLGQTQTLGCVLMRWGYIERELISEDTSPQPLTETTALVISVNGDGADFPNETALAGYAPVAEYTGSASAGNLSPSDDATTNYVVISGSIVLVPRYKDCVLMLGNPFTDEGIACLNGEHGSVHVGRSWWTCATPKSTPVRQPASFGSGLIPWEQLREPQLTYNQGTTGSFADTVHKVDVVACMLVVGDKCVVEVATDGRPSDYEWRKYKTPEECADMDEYYAQSFCIGFNPKIGDGIVGQEYDIANNINHTDGLDVTGLAIPVRRSDKVSGTVKFMILGPVNLIWNKITRRHRTWFRREKWYEEDVAVMPMLANIQINGLEVRVVSDNAMEQPLGDAELVYTSDDGARYSHPMDEVRMAVTSALTEEERTEMGVPVSVSVSCPIDRVTGEGVMSIYRDGEEMKPEQAYVQAYYEAYSQPRVSMRQTVWEEYADQMGAYVHPALPGKTFRVLAVSRDVLAGTATLDMRETW